MAERPVIFAGFRGLGRQHGPHIVMQQAIPTRHPPLSGPYAGADGGGQGGGRHAQQSPGQGGQDAAAGARLRGQALGVVTGTAACDGRLAIVIEEADRLHFMSLHALLVMCK